MFLAYAVDTRRTRHAPASGHPGPYEFGAVPFACSSHFSALQLWGDSFPIADSALPLPCDSGDPRGGTVDHYKFSLS